MSEASKKKRSGSLPGNEVKLGLSKGMTVLYLVVFVFTLSFFVYVYEQVKDKPTFNVAASNARVEKVLAESVANGEYGNTGLLQFVRKWSASFKEAGMIPLISAEQASLRLQVDHVEQQGILVNYAAKLSYVPLVATLFAGDEGRVLTVWMVIRNSSFGFYSCSMLVLPGNDNFYCYDWDDQVEAYRFHGPLDQHEAPKADEKEAEPAESGQYGATAQADQNGPAKESPEVDKRVEPDTVFSPDAVPSPIFPMGGMPEGR